jgi:hypothetical protein
MPKTRTTVTLDQEVIRAVKIRAARSGRRDSEVIEDSLRRDLGLGALEQLWSQVKPARSRGPRARRCRAARDAQQAPCRRRCSRQIAMPLTASRPG